MTSLKRAHSKNKLSNSTQYTTSIQSNRMSNRMLQPNAPPVTSFYLNSKKSKCSLNSSQLDVSLGCKYQPIGIAIESNQSVWERMIQESIEKNKIGLKSSVGKENKPHEKKSSIISDGISMSGCGFIQRRWSACGESKPSANQTDIKLLGKYFSGADTTNEQYYKVNRQSRKNVADESQNSGLSTSALQSLQNSCKKEQQSSQPGNLWNRLMEKTSSNSITRSSKNYCHQRSMEQYISVRTINPDRLDPKANILLIRNEREREKSLSKCETNPGALINQQVNITGQTKKINGNPKNSTEFKFTYSKNELSKYLSTNAVKKNDRDIKNISQLNNGLVPDDSGPMLIGSSNVSGNLDKSQMGSRGRSSQAKMQMDYQGQIDWILTPQKLASRSRENSRSLSNDMTGSRRKSISRNHLQSNFESSTPCYVFPDTNENSQVFTSGQKVIQFNIGMDQRCAGGEGNRMRNGNNGAKSQTQLEKFLNKSQCAGNTRNRDSEENRYYYSRERSHSGQKNIPRGVRDQQISEISFH
ncbi:UNKNOWN [Stylonychia lemnae]|uniref:Uncharacterized protein n=1 Tax=Stylonychia lemnae TaxID=5949 RepID=A0A078AE13_STYLE|nr:UNKNOWN [Stylonychia lemnae]|eukprot:CDW80440.1 UNKNOWN [Stylonychia lemnae]